MSERNGHTPQLPRDDMPLRERQARCHEKISAALDEYGLELTIGYTEAGSPAAVLSDAGTGVLLN